MSDGPLEGIVVCTRADGGPPCLCCGDEAAEYDARWQQVTCSACRRTYRCTPEDDYYAPGGEVITGPESGFCEACLVTRAGLDPSKVMVIDMRDH